MAKLLVPTFAIRLQKRDAETDKLILSPVYHLARARKQDTTVCGEPVCEQCVRVKVAKIPEGAQWCIRCLGAMIVR